MADIKEIGTFRAPYNFVPLNKDVYVPDYSEPSHDIPYDDGEDGLIELSIVNKTPMLIGGIKQKGNNAVFPISIGQDKYFIPGSSIKGMIRAVMEIMTFGKMQQYNKDFFAFRDVANKDKHLQYLTTMEDAKAGWLCAEGNEYRLYKCEFKKIPIDDIKRNPMVGDSYDRSLNAFQKADSFHNALSEYYPLINNMRLVCTGDIVGKKNEYLFSPKTGEGIPIGDDIIDKFFSVYKQSKEYGKINEIFVLLDRIDSGIDIPVFYHCDENGDIATMGITRMYRYPYTFGVENAVQQHLPNGFDYPERIFGFISKNSDTTSLKGRVQIGHATQDEKSILNTIKIQGIVLGTPQASYYPLYLQQDKKNGRYNTYNNKNIEIAGRKRYCVRKAVFNYDQMPQGAEKNRKVQSELNVLPAELSFSCKISVHNLKKTEIGALITAITFYGFDDVYHNIGMGKALGMGKLEIKIKELKGLKHTKEIYMDAFVDEMNSFTKKKYGKLWKDTVQISTLFALAHEHTNSTEDCYMSLKEYTYYKSSFTTREVEKYTIATQKPDPLVKYKGEIEEAKRLASDGLISDALAKLQSIEGEFWKQEHKSIFEGIVQEIKTLVPKTINTTNSQQELDEAKANRLKKGLAKQLEQVKGTLPKILKVLMKWLDDNNNTVLNANDILMLKEHMLKYCPNNKSARNRDDAFWKKLEIISSNAIASNIYNELTNI